MSFNDPVDRIEWRDATSLKCNSWNPNMVFDQELKLLELNILTSGWIQPILVSKDGIVIDGFHRWMLSLESPKIIAKYQGKVPCVIMDVDVPTAMILTVRMNRAKGSHAAVRMSEMIKKLVDEHGITKKKLQSELGATKEEVELLYQDSIFKARNMSKYRYSHAWVPDRVNRSYKD